MHVLSGSFSLLHLLHNSILVFERFCARTQVPLVSRKFLTKCRRSFDNMRAMLASRTTTLLGIIRKNCVLCGSPGLWGRSPGNFGWLDTEPETCEWWARSRSLKFGSRFHSPGLRGKRVSSLRGKHRLPHVYITFLVCVPSGQLHP